MAHVEANTLLRHVRAQAACALPDEQLLREYVQRHSEQAFAALLSRHGPMVWAVCRRVVATEADAEDAFQATFLVLARRAGSIRKQDSLGSWLYGTAYRVATRARLNADRRRRHERAAASRCSVVREEDWRDLAALLDEELMLLPEKYRAPFVLYCLEGKSRKEAAAVLGWKEGTVCSRVAEARKRLQGRLAGRGVGAPPALVRSTLLAVVGEGPLTISASALALAEAVMRPALLGPIQAAASALLLVAAVGAGLAAVGPPAKQAPAAPRVDGLVAKLASEDFAERDAAAKDLARIGPPALDALRKAARHPDLEVRWRAQKLIPAIEHQTEVDALLTPTRVRLVYRDTPVAAAVADFSKKSGVPIQLVDNQNRLKGRTVTLDTGFTTWWDAAEALCRAAGLAMAREALELPYRTTFPGDLLHYNVGLRWTPGRSEALASDSAGAFRVEALSTVSLDDGRKTPQGAHALALALWPEAKVHFQSVQQIRIDRAIDELGQTLRPIGDVSHLRLENVGEYGIVRLAPAEKPSRALTELSGRVTLRVAKAPYVSDPNDLASGKVRQYAFPSLTSGPAGPRTIVYYGMPTLKVEVPFRLRNVPLR